MIYTFTGEKDFILALLCSVAASNADSWASEIGVLSKKAPIMITTFETCKPGISGGITLLGTMAGIAGSIFIAVISILLQTEMQIDVSPIYLFALITICGVIGLFIDSLLGATLQVIYKDEQGEETENSILGQSKSRGLSWINNDFVNVLSSFLIALGVVIFYIQ